MKNLKFVMKEIQIAKRGAYAYTRWLSHDLRAKKRGILYTTVKEGTDYHDPNNKPGGMITFSTDIHEVALAENKVIDWVQQKVVTVQNKQTKDITMKKKSEKHDFTAWTVGKFLSARYTAKNGKVFDDNSISVEIIGIDSNELLNIAKELCVKFLQESVLVKDDFTGKVFLVDVE